jgi:hypothetical protein
MKNNMADKSKNNKKSRSLMSWLGVIAFIAIIVVNIIMWKGYFAEKSQIDVLKDEVAQVNQQASHVARPPSGLESKLLEAQNNLTEALKVFPANVDRNDVVDFILNTANTCHVNMMPLISDGWETESMGKSYLALKYHGTVTGTLMNATNFITLLRNSDYPTMIITGCNVERASGLFMDIPDSNIEVIIDLSLALYSASIQVDKDITS